MTGMQMQEATCGRWRGCPPERITRICTDSRMLETGDAYLALRGQRFDGHAFAKDAVSKGAIALIGDARGLAGWREISLSQLEVQDTLHALGDIAARWRQGIKTRVVAITGSYGKTSLRSMLETLLPQLGLKVAATFENQNNLIGVPLTLLNIEGNEDVALIECGISETGEMSKLAAIVQADATVITGLADAHTEGLGGLAGVVREKMALIRQARPHSWHVLGEGVSQRAREYGQALPDTALDMSSQAEGVVHWTLKDNRLELRQGGQSAQIELALPARHWAANMALAASVAGKLAHVELQAIADALSHWRPVAGRMQVLPGPNGSLLLDDTYNANPASMTAALDTLRSLPGRHFAVLGDMEELGDDTSRLHAAMDISGLDGLILVGEKIRALANRHAEAFWTTDVRDAVRLVGSWRLGSGDYVLIKASRNTGLDAVIRAHTGCADAV